MDFLLHIVVVTGCLLPAVITYNVVFGKGKIFHFGPVGVSILASYVIVLALQASGSFFIAFLAGLLAASAASLLFAWLSLRLEPDALGVMSIAAHLSILAVVLNWNSLTRGALGIPRVPRLPILDSMPAFAVASCVAAVLCVVLVRRLDAGPFGRRLAALAEHPWYAKALGVDQTLAYCVAFLVAGIGVTISNFLHVQYLTLLHPNDYGFPVLVFYVTIVVAGKPGSVPGVALSTVLLVLLREAIRFVPLAPSSVGPVRLMLFGAILFAALWIRRDGVFPRERKV
jgi:branched-chain amino acid transport system permease protein